MISIKPCRALDSTGTEVAIPAKLAHGLDAVATKIRVCMLTIKGQWPDDRLFGLPLRRWVERPAVSAVEVEGAVRLALAQIRAITEVTRVDVVKGSTMTITVEVVVELDEESSVIRVGDLGDPMAPGAWYRLISQTVVV